MVSDEHKEILDRLDQVEGKVDRVLTLMEEVTKSLTDALAGLQDSPIMKIMGGMGKKSKKDS